jgi:hypothetical protein
MIVCKKGLPISRRQAGEKVHAHVMAVHGPFLRH